MTTFADLGIPKAITQALIQLGYEQPTPIQTQSIPILLNCQDLLAQAQTGTGKTAAFALPILAQINLSINQPQAIILAPTRELAIQLAEAFQAYATNLPGFHVLPIYGGQDYRSQLKALKRGTHVVVGTPGRVMDHIRRGTLKFDALKTVVLDEADEMLRMGFIEDVQWILEQIPGEYSTALFSATMPPEIKAVVDEYLQNPQKIQIKAKTRTINTIDQFYTIVAQKNKLEALTRFLEVEDRDGMIIFARTKVASNELAEKLEARGYATAAMNGDMKQAEREKVIKRLKEGSLDIVVATEVAARGLDVDRISHVVNYDIPHDPESYIHRIGRTGRAGRSGAALLLVTPRERRMLNEIERTINMPITQIEVPTVQQINQKRHDEFTMSLVAAMQDPRMDQYREIVETLQHNTESSTLDIAAALYSLSKPKKTPNSKSEINLDFDEERGKKNKSGKKPGGKNAKSGKKGAKRKGSSSDKKHFANKRIKKRAEKSNKR